MQMSRWEHLLHDLGEIMWWSGACMYNVACSWKRGNVFDRWKYIVVAWQYWYANSMIDMWHLSCLNSVRNVAKQLFPMSPKSILVTCHTAFILITRRTLRHRPCPLNTVELQKRASRFLHLSSEQAMKVSHFVNIPIFHYRFRRPRAFISAA